MKEAPFIAPIIQWLDRSIPFKITCDASDYKVGTILGQQKDKKIYVIYYASKMLDEAQQNCMTTKMDLFPVVYAIEKF